MSELIACGTDVFGESKRRWEFKCSPGLCFLCVARAGPAIATIAMATSRTTHERRHVLISLTLLFDDDLLRLRVQVIELPRAGSHPVTEVVDAQARRDVALVHEAVVPVARPHAAELGRDQRQGAGEAD